MDPQPPAPTAPNSPNLSTVPTASGHSVRNPLSVMQPGETIVCAIRRHPIGIIGVYIGSGLLLIVLAVLAFGVAPNVSTSSSHSQIMAATGLGFFVLALIVLAFVFVANKVYWGNSWVVTSDSITQTTQTSLFDKQSSQLSLGNLEDVTAEQNGPIAHLFNYGVLRVETAGERSKFMFLFCPNPNEYAKHILSARERFEQGRRGADLQRPYRGQETYNQPAGAIPPPQASYQAMPAPTPTTPAIPAQPSYQNYDPSGQPSTAPLGPPSVTPDPNDLPTGLGNGQMPSYQPPTPTQPAAYQSPPMAPMQPQSDDGGFAQPYQPDPGVNLNTE